MSFRANLRYREPDQAVVVRPEGGDGTASYSRPLLTRIAPGHARILNFFYRRRCCLEIALAGHKVSVGASYAPMSDASASDITIDLRIDDAPGELTVPRSIIDRLVSLVMPARSFRHLNAVQAAIVLELALSSVLEAIEAHAGARIALMALHSGSVPSKPADIVKVGFALQSVELGAWRSQLTLGTEHALRLAKLIEKHTRPEPAEVDIRVRACLRAAATTLTMRELRSLAAGDVVLADDCCEAVETALLVIAEHLIAPAVLSSEGGCLVATPVELLGSKWEWAMTDHGERTTRDADSERSFDDIPLRVTFEFGQIDLSLGEIRNLAPGSLVPLSRPLEDAVDIVANGRRLGRGTLVSIGDSIGVQITRLFDHG